MYRGLAVIIYPSSAVFYQTSLPCHTSIFCSYICGAGICDCVTFLMTRTARFISIQIMGRTISNGLKHWIAFNYELDYLIAMQEIAAKQQVSITPLVPPLRNPDLFEKSTTKSRKFGLTSPPIPTTYTLQYRFHNRALGTSGMYVLQNYLHAIRQIHIREADHLTIHALCA